MGSQLLRLDPMHQERFRCVSPVDAEIDRITCAADTWRHPLKDSFDNVLRVSSPGTDPCTREQPSAIKDVMHGALLQRISSPLFVTLVWLKFTECKSLFFASARMNESST